MSLIYHTDCEQGGSDWLERRAGKATSTGAECIISLADLYAEKGRDTLKGRRDYALRLATERITGLPGGSGFSTAAMERGTVLEPVARARYIERLRPSEELREVALVTLSDCPEVGDSPDGLIYAEGQLVGGAEIKCGQSEAHWEYLWEEGWESEDLTPRRTVPRRYIRQVLHHLYVTGADWWDFIAYSDAMPEALQLHVVRLTRAEAEPLLARYSAALTEFLAEVSRLERVMRAKCAILHHATDR